MEPGRRPAVAGAGVLSALAQYSDDEEDEVGETAADRTVRPNVFSIVSYGHDEDADAEHDDAEVQDSGRDAAGIAQGFAIVTTPLVGNQVLPPAARSLEPSPIGSPIPRAAAPVTPPVGPELDPETATLLAELEKELPPPPVADHRGDAALESKIAEFLERTRQGRGPNVALRQSKQFHNPTIYEKLVSFCDIDEIGSNFDPAVYDPHGFEEGEFYESLANEQQLMLEQRERDKKGRTTVSFVPASQTSVGKSKLFPSQ